jgi:hypothetical protein
MTYHSRYLQGEHIQVYAEMQSLNLAKIDTQIREDVDKVLTETFQRIRSNLEVIHTALVEQKYQFKTAFDYNFQRPLHDPLPDTENLLTQLNTAVSPFGHLPLSIQYFHRIVGGVNFGWDYETNELLIWKLADPIQICSLDDVVSQATNEYWKEDIQLYVDDEEFGTAFIELAADALHKDNISGGPAYSIEITDSPQVDSAFLNEPHQTTFINYLRICFEHCGFPGIANSENDYKEFFEQVKPKMKKI